MHKIKYYIIFFVTHCVTIGAKEKAISSSEALYKLLSKAPYSVVMFYEKSKENMKDKTIKQQISDLEVMFKSVSNNDEYKEADLQFLRVDVARKNLMSAAQRFNITKFPTFMLFVGREPIPTTISGSLSQGYIYRSQLEALINAYLKDRMQVHLKNKAESRAIALEKAKIRAYETAAYAPYWYGYYGPYGYPYWWYGYPYGPFYVGR